VLDGMETLRICTAYELDGQVLSAPPVDAGALARCKPRFIELPGWSESTVGTGSLDALPQQARDYLAKIEELGGVPIDVVSTGPDRSQTLILRHPFAD
jgi:adenylosuccinate synthase